MKQNLFYYKNLDGLRGVAAISVLIFHFFSSPITDYIDGDFYKKTTEILQHGVSLFFVLSGFVITRILINNKNDHNYFSSFYWRRAIRISPLYYFFLFFWFFIMPFILNGTDAEIVSFSYQLPTYLYLQNFQWLTDLSPNGSPGHYWSLAVEEHFYLVWPLLVYILPTKHIEKSIIIIVILTIPLKYYLLEKGIIINKITPARFDQILLGALLATYEYKKYFVEKRNFANKILLFSALLIIPLILLILFYNSVIPNIKDLLKYNVLGLFFFVIIGFLIMNYNKYKINKMLNSLVMQYLGKISYGIYIWHVFILMFVNRYIKTEIIILDLLTCILMTILISHISFNYFEKLFFKYK